MQVDRGVSSGKGSAMFELSILDRSTVVDDGHGSVGSILDHRSHPSLQLGYSFDLKLYLNDVFQ